MRRDAAAAASISVPTSAMIRPGVQEREEMRVEQGGPGLFRRSAAHLEGVGESYLEHMRFAGGVGWRMIAAGIACMMHALVPAIFTDRASRTIEGLHRVIHD